MNSRVEQERGLTAPLRWAGSKRKIIHHLVAELPPEYQTYIEPFAGSAYLYFYVRPRRAILGDLNKDLMQFYGALRERPEAVLRSASHFRRSATGYYKARSRFIKEHDPVKRAALFLFLNRFCFNGIYRTNTRGDFNVPYGTRTGGFPTFSEISDLSKQLSRAKLVCADFEEVAAGARKGDFVYLDPPYVYRSRKDRGEYGKGSFALGDIPRLQSVVRDLDRRRVKFLLSYLDCPEIHPTAALFKSRRIPVARTVAGLTRARQVVSEVLIRNF